LLDAFAYESGVDAGVDDEMRDMDVLRPELPRHALGDGAQAELGARKRRIADAAANARGRAGEEDAALAARQHQAGGFASGQETGVARHLPDLAEHPLGRLEQGKIDVAADVEDADFKRRVSIGGAQEGSDVILLASVEPARDDFAASGFDSRDERRELL